MDSSLAYLDLLPVETWFACWALCSHRQLRRLSLVCRLFRSIVLPLLLQHQTFDVAAVTRGIDLKNWIQRVDHLHRTAVRLDRLSGAPYASFVRSWHVTLTKGDRLTRGRLPGVENFELVNLMNDRVVATFCTTLRFYQNLSSLHLTHFTIDAPLRETLTLLSGLEDLHLCDCSITVSHGFLRLQRLKIINIVGSPLTADHAPLQIASPETLRTLTVDNSFPSLSSGFGAARLDQLVDLSIGFLRDVDALPPFLEQCPLLESFTLRVLNPQTTLPPVSTEVIPLLSPFHPHSATVLFDLLVTWQEDALTEVCRDIAHSSAPLQSLTLLPPVAATLEFLVTLTSLFPELKTLSITVWGGPTKRGRRACALGTPTMRSSKPIPVDPRRSDLNDDAAFDNIPADDISDSEPDETHTIVVVKAPVKNEDPSRGSATHPSTILHIIFEWILNSLLPLPSSIEILRLKTHGGTLKLSGAELHETVAALTAMYPSLRELQSGASTNWMRQPKGDLWKAGGDNPWIRVIL
ncbi:hypothetical protein MVEN_00492900 [Mycena venus]|uniref:F-box domain-containing protein n=1 Tax=Mycena venus TaxID=2733690 RepID=A0A8H7D8G9_9AGAR|nr:hypothetical protein MVEN_00492900 [Mycena venus]